MDPAQPASESSTARAEGAAAAPAAPAQSEPPASKEAARARRLSDGASMPVLPDCCNLGILTRILVPLNVAGLLVALASGVADGLLVDRLVEIAAVLEPSALLSLALICAARKTINGKPVRVQWTAGIAVPVAVTLIASAVCAPLLLPESDLPTLAVWVAVRGLIAGGIAALAIEFFRLRALSFSPSLAEARLQALQARIRPHFLFNSLNTVLGLMRGDPRRAEYTLENLADLFRVFMRDTRELVPLDEEVVTCQQYLAIEQLRLGERLQVRWQIEQMPGDALLPALLLQPLVENAVHHGIEPRQDAGEIEICVSRVGERVRVEILNPANPEQPQRPGNQMALSNVRERLMLLYDVEAELKTAVEDDRFRLLLEFPYRKERRRRDVRRHFNPYR